MANAATSLAHFPSLADLEAAELRWTRAIQRRESSKAACMEMFGSLSILVVPKSSFKVLADASWECERALMRLGDLKARRRAGLSLLKYAA